MNTSLKMKQIGLLALALAGVNAGAQSAGPFTLNWNTLDGGGGVCGGGITASGGTKFSLSGTVGQPDAGTAIGGGFTLAGGFWPATTIEVGPRLRISAAGGSVIVSWPATAADYYLMHCTDLARKNWVSNTTAVVVIGTERRVVEPAAGAARFYQLRKL